MVRNLGVKVSYGLNRKRSVSLGKRSRVSVCVKEADDKSLLERTETGYQAYLTGQRGIIHNSLSCDQMCR